MSSDTHASIWASAWSVEPGAVLVRVGGQAGGAHGSSWRVGRRRSAGCHTRPSARDRRSRRRARAPAAVSRRRAPGGPLGPVVEQLGQPATEAAGRRRVGEVGDERAGARRASAPSGRRRPRASRGPLPGCGSPTRTRTRARTPSQLVPLIAIGTIGTPARRAKYAGPRPAAAARARRGGSAPPPKITIDPAVVEHALDPARGLDQVGLLRAVRDRRSRSTRSAGSGRPRAMSSSLGPNIATFGLRGQHREQHQRVGPVEVVEARRSPGPGGEALAALEPHAEHAAHEDGQTSRANRTGTAGRRERP